MATTRIMPLHIGKGRTESQAISDIIDYVANPQKTDNGKLITGYGCDSRTADAEFLLAKRQYIAATGRVRGADDVIAYHVRQSFKPGEITPEEIMVNFDCVYNIINDEEKRNVVTALIKEIEIYRNDESEYPLKRIGLNFPVFKDGGEVTELLWDKGNTVETVCCLQKI